VNTRVIIKQQVRGFLQTLAPEPRRKLWRGLKDLAQDKGDLKQLEGNLHPFWRLRVDRMRVIYEPRSVAGERQLVCFFADHRSTVYAVLEQLLVSGMVEELKD
jgi:mRNA-degrading endonuclease RelE of RelBE toxin-antitoxin system